MSLCVLRSLWFIRELLVGRQIGSYQQKVLHQCLVVFRAVNTIRAKTGLMIIRAGTTENYGWEQQTAAHASPPQDQSLTLLVTACCFCRNPHGNRMLRDIM
jgi:hypothetical protein